MGKGCHLSRFLGVLAPNSCPLQTGAGPPLGLHEMNWQTSSRHRQPCTYAIFSRNTREWTQRGTTLIIAAAGILFFS